MNERFEVTGYADRHHDEVVQLWQSVFGYESPQNEPSLSIAKKVAVTDGLFFVAESDGQVIGTVMGGYDGHRGWIYSLAVHPGHRGQTLGTALMRRVEDALTELGCMKINLQVMPGNREVEEFYQKLGYATEPRISMGKQIPVNIKMPESR